MNPENVLALADSIGARLAPVAGDVWAMTRSRIIIESVSMLVGCAAFSTICVVLARRALRDYRRERERDHLLADMMPACFAVAAAFFFAIWVVVATVDLLSLDYATAERIIHNVKP